MEKRDIPLTDGVDGVRAGVTASEPLSHGLSGLRAISHGFWVLLQKENLLRALALSEITSPLDQVTTIQFLLEDDAVEYYHSLTKQVQDEWFQLMRVLGQRFNCISHDPVYLSRMLTLESEFPRHADHVKELRTCVIKSKVNTSELQIGCVANPRFVEGLSNYAAHRQ